MPCLYHNHVTFSASIYLVTILASDFFHLVLSTRTHKVKTRPFPAYLCHVPPNPPSTSLPQMAKDDGRPSAAEKGKGKVDDIRGEKGKGKATPEKDGKPTTNGKVVEGLPEGADPRAITLYLVIC